MKPEATSARNAISPENPQMVVRNCCCPMGAAAGSINWLNDYFPVAFDIGTPAECIRNANNGLVLAFNMVNSPSSINVSLLVAAREQHE